MFAVEFFNQTSVDFNSIKVRLERESFLCNVNRLTRFQFHKGAIRTDTTPFWACLR